MTPLAWHILTGEYPPMPGGVADYARLVARGLAAAGERVVVWAPASCHPPPDDAGVRVRPLPDHFGRRGRAVIDAEVGASSRVLVQYVPHAFAAKSMNVPFAAWLWRRRKRWAIDVMFHEVGMPFGWDQPIRYNVAAGVHRSMARLLIRSADRVFASTAAWEAMLKPWLRAGQGLTVAPVPSNIEPCRDAAAAAAARARLGGKRLVGHFGGCAASMVPQLTAVVRRLTACDPDLHFAFIGGSSSSAGRQIRQALGEPDRVVVTGRLCPDEVANAIAACDLMTLPYPDGVTTRRSSGMACLAAGVPVVTSIGRLTEPLWPDSGAVSLVRAGDDVAPPAVVDELVRAAQALLGDAARRRALGTAGRQLYERSFTLPRTITMLRERRGPEGETAT